MDRSDGGAHLFCRCGKSVTLPSLILAIFILIILGSTQRIFTSILSFLDASVFFLFSFLVDLTYALMAAKAWREKFTAVNMHNINSRNTFVIEIWC